MFNTVPCDFQTIVQTIVSWLIWANEHVREFIVGYFEMNDPIAFICWDLLLVVYLLLIQTAIILDVSNVYIRIRFQFG